MNIETERNWLLYLQRMKKSILFGEPARKGFRHTPKGIYGYHQRGGRIFFTTPRIKVRPRNPKPWQLNEIRYQNREHKCIYDGCIFP